MPTLVIGNRNYSSWSLRAWLYLTESGVEFDEIRVPLFTGDWRERLATYTPAGRVPVLLDGELRIWDTTAIIAHVHEKYAEALSWPEDPIARATARSITGEMHSGFLALRDELPQNLRARTPRDRSAFSAGCRAQIERIESIWSHCREEFGRGGPWLFGSMTIADVMFVPVALRFRTYGVAVSPQAQEFVDAVTANPNVTAWSELAAGEPERIEFIDALRPAGDSPLTLG